jgi:cell division septation protein DedD
MPQETLLALGAIVAVVIGAVALLEGSTTSGRDEGDRLVDSVRGLLEETGALAAGRAVNRLLANRPVRQARRPRSIPLAYPTPTTGRDSAANAAPEASVTGVGASAAVAHGIDDVPTEAWSPADGSIAGDRPPTQPNRIIVSGVRAPGRGVAGLLRRPASDSALPPRPRAGAVRPGPVSTRLRRSRSLSGTRLLQALSALLLIALLVLLGVLILRPAGDSAIVLGATSAPSGFFAVAPTATPTGTPTASPSPSPTPALSAIPTPSDVATPPPTAAPTPKPTPKPTAKPTARPTARPTPMPTPNPTQPPPTSTPTPSPTTLSTPAPTPTPVPTPVPTPTPAPTPTPVPTARPTPKPHGSQ